MVWVIAFGELFFGDLWCVVWGYGGMRTHFSLLNPAWRGGGFVWGQWLCLVHEFPCSPGFRTRWVPVRHRVFVLHKGFEIL